MEKGARGGPVNGTAHNFSKKVKKENMWLFFYQMGKDSPENFSRNKHAVFQRQIDIFLRNLLLTANGHNSPKLTITSIAQWKELERGPLLPCETEQVPYLCHFSSDQDEILCV